MPKELYCPFTNGKCNYDCVLNNKCFDENDIDGCMLRDAVEQIMAFGKGISIANKNISADLKSINDNASSDHSYSFEIKNKLDNIETLLEKIVNK